MSGEPPPLPVEAKLLEQIARLRAELESMAVEIDEKDETIVALKALLEKAAYSTAAWSTTSYYPPRAYSPPTWSTPKKKGASDVVPWTILLFGLAVLVVWIVLWLL